MTIRICAKSCKLLCLFSLIFLSFGFASAQVTQGSTTVGGGTLSWNASEDGGLCSPGNDYMVWDFSFFEFNYNNVIYELTGNAFWYQDNNGTGCPISGSRTATLTLPSAVGFGSNCTIVFTPTSSSQGYANLGSSCTVTYSGIIGPKYIVVGVTYAPPGDGSGAVSTVQYMGTTAVGTTTTKGSSFSNDVGFSIAFQNGVGTPGGTTLAGGGVSLTATESTDYTQTSNNSSSITLNKSSSNTYTTNGYPTNYPITSGAAPNINPTALTASSIINPHDWDVIQVWLNAEQVFTAFAATSTTPVTFQLNGYAYDPTDLAGPEVYPVQVGCLNGDFTVAYCATQQGVLNRAWVTGQMSPTTGAVVNAPGCPPTAQSPSICPNTQDAYNILATDPLAYNPGGSTYTLLNSSPLPTTTSDGRFTQFGYPPNPIDYEAGQTDGYSLTQMNTQTESNGGSSQVNEKISVSEKISAGFLGLLTSSITFTESDTMVWTNTWLNSLTTTQTVQDAYSIKGSNPPYYVPGEFLVYQDNLFGTFMFYPSN